MNEPLMMTPQELIMYIIGGVIAASVAIEKLSKGAKVVAEIIARMRKPNQIQDESIEENRVQIEKHAEYLKNDDNRIKMLESWVTLNEKVIKDHDRRLTMQKDSTESLRRATEVQMNALLALLQAIGKMNPEDKGIDSAQKEILQFLSHEKLGGNAHECE